MLEEPVCEQRERLASVAVVAGPFPQVDAHFEGSRGTRPARWHEGLDAPDTDAVQVDGEIEPAIFQAARTLEPGPEAGLLGGVRR